LDYAETAELLCRRFGFKKKPEVTVLGIGPGDGGAMTIQARRALDEAECLIGAPRVLDSADTRGKRRIEAISSADIRDAIINNSGYSRFAVVMSGDVGFFSGAKKLLPLLDDCVVTVLPGISSLVYLCSKLGCGYEDVVSVSLHGRDRDIASDVRRNPRIFVLTGGSDGMRELCRRLVDSGLGQVNMHIGERLSYPDERISSGTALELSKGNYFALSVALIDNSNAEGSFSFGLPDSAFLRNTEGEKPIPMTKSEVRAVCLSKLRLTEKSVCWDVGAGTGSVSVEMALAARRGRVYAIERRKDAAELIRANAESFGLDNIEVVTDSAPEACRRLPPPSHIFIGGSSGQLWDVISLGLEKNPSVRIVATAVTLETVSALTDCMVRYPFDETEAVSLSVARDSKAGTYHLMRAENPVTVFTMQAKEKSR
ncbi:MAG: precorrin-6y C5,15-methyltransferase (decarboxylating) subunit CbiE, partial [Oscillospiraceae bacterium]|nr:precorrin-6y C5,15-methyltransferase (decarboxylating) subunit CbiE [Oscillospiraceae bacterium]